jgi:hypothetical protein
LSEVNPSGIYTLICNGEKGTLELTVDAHGNLFNSRIDIWGQTSPISGTFNEISCLIEFTAEEDNNQRPRFTGYVMTLRSSDKLAFAGTGHVYIPGEKGLASAENGFGWWATLEPSKN